jgi:hypothetical protein
MLVPPHLAPAHHGPCPAARSSASSRRSVSRFE